MTPKEIQEIENLFERKFEHHKNNINTAISGVYKELESFRTLLHKHEHNAAVNQLEMQRKIDLILIELQGTQMDNEKGIIADVKRLKAAIEIVKHDKTFMRGGWWVVVKLLGFLVGFASFFILIYKFITELWK